MRQTFTKSQLASLLVLRFLAGWHILYEGTAKALNPQWSSLSYLQESQGILSGFSEWIISNPGVLAVVDFLNVYGLIAIGLGLITGLFFKVAAIAGAILIFVYYLNSPPLIGIEYVLPSEGHNLIINRTLIEAVALVVLALFSTSKIFGLDALISNPNKKEEPENERS
jgi:thiosulfate dehydrogenase (quinone) large subunit